jgi:hypothetical protein
MTFHEMQAYGYKPTDPDYREMKVRENVTRHRLPCSNCRSRITKKAGFNKIDAQAAQDAAQQRQSGSSS